MNTQKTISFDERFQPGKIVDLGPDICRIELDQKHGGIQFARVRTDGLPKGKSLQDYRIKDQVTVFLQNPVQGFPDSMHGSIAWGQQENNPWISSPLVVGALEEATAIRYLELQGVFVRLSSGIEALLRVRAVPGGWEDITQVIDLGDRLVVQLTEVRKSSLEVDVSITEALRTLRKRETERREREFNRPQIELYPGPKLTMEGLANTRLAVLGPDRLFSQQLGQWLADFGGLCVPVQNPHELLDILQAINHPTHVLSVASVWRDRAQASQAEERVKAKSIQWLWIGSGGADVFPPFPAPAVTLPLNIGHLVRWQAEGIVPPSISKQSQPFAFSDYQMEHVQRLSNRLLEKICTDLTLQGALWCRWERQGVYVPRAFWGLRKEAVEVVQPQLGQTFIASAIELASEGRDRLPPLIRAVSSSGPLRAVAPEDSDMICFLPLPYVSLDRPVEISRVVAFFYRQGDHPKVDDLMSRLQPYIPAMQTMVDALHFAAHNETLSTLAGLGVNSAAYLHELGQAALPIKDFLDNAGRADRSPDPEEWRALKKELAKLLRLAKSDLSVIRKRQGERISLAKRLADIARLFKFRASKIDCVFWVTMPDHPMRISVPALLFDQVIGNLLDNALSFVINLPINMPRIEVRLDFDARNWERPLVIEISDNGPGVRASMQDKIFAMRDSEKEAGTGMGLYIVKNYLNAVGGEIELRESIRWRKTVFQISLPILLDKQIS